MSKQTTDSQSSNIFAKEKLTNPHLRNITFFALGLVLGWLVLGWGLFPAKTAPVAPTNLQPDTVNEYLLMTAEGYATTHDLRAAARRLRFWDDPNVLGPKLNTLAHELETTNPAGMAYLQLLIADLHLPVEAAPQQVADKTTGGFNLIWLLIPLLAVAVLAVIILIAQRFNLLSQEAPVLAPEQPEFPKAPQAPSLIDDQPEESPLFQPAEPLMPERETEPFDLEPPQDDIEIEDEIALVIPETEPEIIVPEILDDEEQALDFVEVEDDLLFEDVPEFLSEDAQATPPEPDEDDLVPPNAFESPETTPVPLPPHHDDDNPAPQLLRFDGNPSYNTIIAIEPNDDYLGEFGLSANQTAPNNPNLTLTLEVWLFDKSDTQTTELTLVPPVIAADPELKARYIKEEGPILALKQGETFALETAELKVEGRVRQVMLGAATRDGVPVIERAEIELSGRKKA